MQQKTDDPWEGELFPEIKNALHRYINCVRPNTVACSNIFITLAPPYTPVDNRVINTMMHTQFEHAKINVAGRMHGSRALRSSVASNMINDGISTEVVRRVLGHGTKRALKHFCRICAESKFRGWICLQKQSGKNLQEILQARKRKAAMCLYSPRTGDILFYAGYFQQDWVAGSRPSGCHVCQWRKSTGNLRPHHRGHCV